MKNAWLALSMVVAGFGLIAGVLGSAAGLFVLVYELLVYGGEWDGIGIVIGLLILSLTVPLSIASAVLIRLLGRADPIPGVAGTGVGLALLIVMLSPGQATLWIVPGTGVMLLVLAVLATRFGAPAPPASGQGWGPAFETDR